MATLSNTNAVLKIKDSTNTFRDFSDYIGSSSLSRSVGTADVTTLGDGAVAYIATLTDGTVSLEGPFNATAYGYLRGIEGSAVDAEFYPLGTGAGSPKEAFKVIVTSIEVAAATGEAVTLTGELQITGPVTGSTV